MKFIATISMVMILMSIPMMGASQEIDTLTVQPDVKSTVTSTGHPFGGVVLSTDSLLRWQQWSGFGELVSRQSKFTVRDIGGYGRNTGIGSSTASINSDRLRWNGVILNNPLTGQFNSAEIPIDQSYKVVHIDNGISELGIYPNIYYVLKPLTVIQYEQSSYEYRNLDGILALPLNDRLRIQASYQGQKDDGNYVRSNFEGRRSAGNLQYELRNQWTADAFWLYQGAEMQESMGYQLDDPSEFGFDRFRAMAVSSNTASMRRLFLFGVKLSPNGATVAPQVTLYRKLHRHEWRTSDTTSIRIQEWGLNARYTLPIGLQATVVPYTDVALVSGNLGDVQLPSRAADVTYTLGVRGEYKVGTLGDVIVHGEKAGMLTGSGSLVDAAGRIHMPYETDVMVGYATIATPQPTLSDIATVFNYTVGVLPRKTNGSTLYANVNKSVGVWRFRFDYRHTSSTELSAVRNDRSIAAMSVDGSAVISGWVERHSDRSEVLLGFNRTAWRFSDGMQGPSNEHRLISSAFWKGYAFNRAAYLKGGAVYSATLSDTRSMAYLPELGTWLFNSDAAAVPVHHRLDLEFAARVRSMFITGRLENTLDGWTQKGYFQTLPYPMPGRRFRIGLKVHFRD